MSVIFVFGGALAAWAGSLALFWIVFRSWQFLADAMDRGAASGWPKGPEMGRGQVMALQTRVFVFDLPEGAPDDARRHARRFRRAVLGLIVVLCALMVAVTLIEPRFLGIGRAFFVGLMLWGALHGLMMWRWRGAAKGQVAE